VKNLLEAALLGVFLGAVWGIFYISYQIGKVNRKIDEIILRIKDK